MTRPSTTVTFPRFLSATAHGGDSRAWHAMGLCSQVHEVMSCLLAGGCSDERLWDVTVTSVDPLPGSNKLLIRVGPTNVESTLNAWEILAALKKARGFFRREIANEIHRKRVPDLEFGWVLPEEVPHEEPTVEELPIEELPHGELPHEELSHEELPHEELPHEE